MAVDSATAAQFQPTPRNPDSMEASPQGPSAGLAAGKEVWVVMKGNDPSQVWVDGQWHAYDPTSLGDKELVQCAELQQHDGHYDASGTWVPATKEERLEHTRQYAYNIIREHAAHHSQLAAAVDKFIDTGGLLDKSKLRKELQQTDVAFRAMMRAKDRYIGEAEQGIPNGGPGEVQEKWESAVALKEERDQLVRQLLEAAPGDRARIGEKIDKANAKLEEALDAATAATKAYGAALTSDAPAVAYGAVPTSDAPAVGDASSGPEKPQVAKPAHGTVGSSQHAASAATRAKIAEDEADARKDWADYVSQLNAGKYDDANKTLEKAQDKTKKLHAAERAAGLPESKVLS